MDKSRLVELAGIKDTSEKIQYVLVEAGGSEFNQLDIAAQKVWTAKGEAKKAALISLIKEFQFKGKQEKHLTKAENMSNPNKMDKFAADLMQIGHKDKVI